MALLLGTAALTGGLLAVSVAESNRRRAAMRAMLSDPSFHAEIAQLQMMRDVMPIPVLFVHVGQVDAASHLDQAKLRVRVKYGESGNYLQQSTADRQAVRSEDGEQILATFGETLAFPGRVDLSPVLRIRIEKVGFFNQVIAKCDINVNGSADATFSHDLCLFGSSLGHRRELLGQLQISTCLRYISRQELFGRTASPIVHAGLNTYQYGAPPAGVVVRPHSGNDYDAEYEAAIAESLRMSSGNANAPANTCAAAVAVPTVAGEAVEHGGTTQAQGLSQPVIVQGRIVR